MQTYAFTVKTAGDAATPDAVDPTAVRVYESGAWRHVTQASTSASAGPFAKRVVDLAVVLSMADVEAVGTGTPEKHRCGYFYQDDTTLDVPLTLAAFLDCLRCNTTMTATPAPFTTT